MSSSIKPQYTSIDGLSIRYAESEPGGRDVLLLSPWPETVFAFDQTWAQLSQGRHLVAVEAPGFGKSEGRSPMMNPQAVGEFIVRAADAFGLRHPHVVGPDIGTPSALFAAASAPDRFASLVIGSGGVAVPVDVTGPLRDWVDAVDLQPYRDVGGRKIVEIAVGTIDGYTPSAEIQEDYASAYEGDRFASTVPFAQAYKTQLPILAKLLPTIEIPVRVVQGADDQVVPSANTQFLADRLPHCRVDLIAGAGHFCWEERPDEYARLAIDWWNTVDRSTTAS